MEPISAIAAAVGQITQSVTAGINNTAQRKHERTLADYENSQFKQFYAAPQQSNFETYALAGIVIIAVVLVIALIFKKKTT